MRPQQQLRPFRQVCTRYTLRQAGTQVSTGVQYARFVRCLARRNAVLFSISWNTGSDKHDTAPLA